MNNLLNRARFYFGITMLYGFARESLISFGREKAYYNYKSHREEKKPMLRTEKAGKTLHSAFAAPVAWPFMLAEDAVYLELRLRDKDPAAYGRKPYGEHY